MREDVDFIKMDLDSLLNDGDITEESIENIKQSIDNLVSDYEEHIDDLNNELNDLEDELNEKQGYDSVEEFASAMLTEFTGHEPNMGEVLSLKEDLEKLLTTKYHISLGNL
jgi:oligoendopeptidase F